MTAPEISAAEAVERARTLSSAGRTILGITGPPGSGKSTLAERIASALGGRAVVVPMDGFHLAQAELRRLGREDRKGAPDTFDADGYVALLSRLRCGRTAYAPAFDRAVEEPVAGSILVHEDVLLVITEGNYLLHEAGAWAGVRPLLDEVWYVDTPEVLRTRLLVERHVLFGKPETVAQDWVERSDRPNAELVVAARHAADVLVRWAV